MICAIKIYKKQYVIVGTSDFKIGFYKLPEMICITLIKDYYYHLDWVISLCIIKYNANINILATGGGLYDK